MTAPTKLRLKKPAPDLHEAISSVEAAIADIRAGKMVILVDDEDRENEGDLCMAAEKVTPEAINFMVRYGRGLVCLSARGFPESPRCCFCGCECPRAGGRRRPG